MSRSCQSATFSSPTSAWPRTTRASPQIRSATTGLRLCGIADEPFWPRANGSSTSRTSVRARWRISSANRSSEAATSASAPSSSAWRSRCEDLRRGGAGSRPRRSQAIRSTSGSIAAYVPTAPESLPTRVASSARASRVAAAVELERPAGELEPERRRLGVDAVRAADRERRRGARSARATTAAKRAVEPVEHEPAGVLELERERRVDDVGRGQAVVEPAARRRRAARRPRRRTRPCRGASAPRSPRRARASGGRARRGSARRPRPARRRPRPSRRARRARPRASARACSPPTRPRPWPAGSSAAITGSIVAVRSGGTAEDPRGQDRGVPRVVDADARDGTPGGICAIESSASSPSRTLSDERSGTPITGRSVCAATTPGSAAARPAPAISTRSPRSRADARVLGDGVGRPVRRAHLELVGDAARVELVERRLHPLAVGLRADEDADERRCLSRGHAAASAAMSRAVAHPVERDRLARLVRARARLADGRRRAPVTSRMRPPFVTSAAVASAVPAWKTSAPAASASVDARRSACRCRRARVVAGREHDRDRRRVRTPRARRRASSPRAAAASAAEQVALEPRQDRLRLGIAEAAVELEHPRAVRR